MIANVSLQVSVLKSYSLAAAVFPRGDCCSGKPSRCAVAVPVSLDSGALVCLEPAGPRRAGERRDVRRPERGVSLTSVSLPSPLGETPGIGPGSLGIKG